MIKDLFPEQAERVFQWNEIARKDPPTQEQQEGFVEEEIKEYKRDRDNIVGAMDAFADIFVTGVYLEKIGEDSLQVIYAGNLLRKFETLYDKVLLAEVLNEVLDSNDSKFWNKDDHDAASIVAECIRLGEETGLRISVRQTKDKIIFLDENMKVRKPTGFREPDLETIMKKYGKEV